MLPKTQPLSEETKGPSTSTDTTKRRLLFRTRRNVVAAVFLIGLITNSLVSNTYSKMRAYAPSISSSQNQMNEMNMTKAMEQPTDTEIPATETMKQNNDTEIIAQETAPKRLKQHNATDSISKESDHKRMSPVQHSLGDSEPTKKPVEALASCNETTVIITSNFIPISPSLAMINKTIQSLKRLRGLCPTSPLIITVDGINKKLRSKHNNTDERLAQYVQALKETYNQDHHTILASNRTINLTNQVQNAMKQVKTEFVYVIQHDMPFVRHIDHTEILKSMDEYPDVLRIVRFNLRSNVRRNVEGVTTCYNETTPVDAINGINLIKTWVWSDNNHLTRRSYYEEMFKMFQERLGYNPRFMEWAMRGIGEKNCSYWGTFYYGRHGLPPTIGHLDGQRKTSYARRRRR